MLSGLKGREACAGGLDVLGELANSAWMSSASAASIMFVALNQINQLRANRAA